MQRCQAAPWKHLRDRPGQPLVGVGDHEAHALHAALAQAPEEPEPRLVGLGVDDRDAQHAPPAALVAADRGHHRRRGDAALPAALDVGGVEPHVGHRGAGQRPADKLVDVGVQAGAYGADLVLAQARDAHRLGHALDLAGAGAARVHLGDSRRERPVDPLVALDHRLREEAAEPDLGHAQREVAQAGLEHALAVSVARDARLGAELLGFGVHHGADDLLGEQPQQPLDVDEPVGAPRQRGVVGHSL